MANDVTVKFLLVDDLDENLLSLEALLRRDGLTLFKAKSGPEALEILLEHDVALALLDVQMPGMNGFELAELMRGNQRTGRVPIIFLTAGNADSQRRFRGYEAGAVDFIHKPVEPDILRSKTDVFFELNCQQQLLANQRDELLLALKENAKLLRESESNAAALKEADIRKDEFLATLAHELRNPLAPIRNGLHILQLSNDATVNTDIQNMMERQLTHLVRLIDDLLDVARVSQGKIELRRQRMMVQDALQAALEASQPLIEEGKHQLNLDISEEKLWVEGDLTRLAQIVSNLLNNAAKYTPVGGRITLRAQRQGSEAVIEVIDNGIGIASDMLGKVFDIFTQVGAQDQRPQGGLGIGLALVKRLVEMHNGQIIADSKGGGKGSVFKVVLPLAVVNEAVISPALEQSSSTPPNVLKTAQPLDILVVDDNLPSAQTIGWMLELIGHKSVVAHDGIKALEFIAQSRPDAILLDIGLPGMNGYDLCREIRKLPHMQKTLLIAQTGWGQEKDRKLAREAGFDHHLVKPVKLEELAALLGDLRL